MFSSTLTSLQKTYDECFLTCSTAVYFEGQNNEKEALRSWKSALDQIYAHNAYRPAHYRPKTETERALQESLRQLELQCKERVDLLEALERSRREAATEENSNGPARTAPTPPPHRTPVHSDERAGERADSWLGGGTVPPVGYADLSRPPLPHRPSLPSLPSRRNSPADSARSVRTLDVPQASSRPSLSPARMSEQQRTPSPEKRSGTRMLRTLRSGGTKEGKRPSSAQRPSSNSSSTRPPVAATAANLAFGSNASANASRPVYQSNPSTDSLVASQGAAGRSSFDRSRSGNEPCSLLASSAAARSWNDLGTDKSPAVARPPALPTYPPSFPNNSRVRHPRPSAPPVSVAIEADDEGARPQPPTHRKARAKQNTVRAHLPDPPTPDDAESGLDGSDSQSDEWKERARSIMKHLPRGVDEAAAQQILNEIVIRGDEVHWEDIAGLEVAKSALKEAVVYPFLRPDLFMGLREPARGMLLFGPPGTGKTMLARAVATESKSTFFAISASSLTSKFLGESEKLVRALFSLAKLLAPSIIFVDEIDSLLSSRASAGEHEATRRIKTEFLIQWSDLQRAAAGREQNERDKERGDASRVLVLAATNLPWAIDEAARRRFVRRQYIPLPEDHERKVQLRTLLSHQKHELDEEGMDRLVALTEGFSGSDITSLAKDAAMGPLRSLGEKLLHMTMDEIRPMRFEDFYASLTSIRPSVSKSGLKQYEDWAKEFGERGG